MEPQNYFLSPESLIRDNKLRKANAEEPLWDKLIDEIIGGNVIPVIGADMLIDGPNNPHALILNALANLYEVDTTPQSFSDLIYDQRLKDDIKEIIYYDVNELLLNGRFRPSERLQKLLSIKYFPFVISTSFTPVAEQVMQSVWKDELRVLRFNNNPLENQDIKNGDDMRKPTVYYMFGRVGEGVGRYALTDNDMLDFVSSWLSQDNNTRPKNLCNELKDKYLLMLGNNYNNWLFRFVWYSMRKKTGGKSMLAYDNLDESLINFLSHNDTFTKQNTAAVIDTIESRLKSRLKARELELFDAPAQDMDIFISYSRSDSAIAEAMYNAFTSLGIRVWYDKKNLTDGGYFMDEIYRAIRTARYFVPIFTTNITKEKADSHVYRNEWEEAVRVATSMGRTYIIPVAEKGFDFYKAIIPEKIQKHNAVLFDSTDNIENVVQRIIHKMNQQ